MKRIALVAVGVLALAGCGGDADLAAAPTVTVTETVTVSAEPSAEPEPSDMPSEGGTADEVAVGRTQSLPEIDFTVEEFAPTVEVANRDGERLSGAMVKACVTRLTDHEGTAFSWSPWSVHGADGSTFQESSSTWGDWPTPMYPNGEHDGTFVDGDCARGWIFFDTINEAELVQVRYTNPNTGGTLRWSIP